MLKLVFLLLISYAQLGFSQDFPRDLEFIETHNTQSMPFGVPLFIDLEGNLNILSQGTASLSLRPIVKGAWKKSKSLYINPITSSGLSFNQRDEKLGWTQVKRLRWELGLGLGAVMKSLPLSAGLTPYRGARHVVVRQVKYEKEKTSGTGIPKDLSDMESWVPGDRGSYEAYGGVHFHATASYLGVGLTGGVTFQNLFNIVITKIKDNKIQLSIIEESLSKRRVDAGAVVAQAKLNFFDGKSLATHFILDLSNDSDYALYRLGIKGKLTELQEKLPPSSQKMEWRGSEKIGYLGIPGVIGKYLTRAEYEMNFSGDEEVLDLKSKRSSGIFLPLRNHNKMVYQTKSALTLFWYSEMNSTNVDVFNRKFLLPGKLMGARGFNSELPEWKKMGSTLSQIGLSFTRKEIESVTPEQLEEILAHFRVRCEEMKQPCAGNKVFNKLAQQLRGYLNLEWDQVKDKIGFVMLDEPSLIYAFVKSMKSPKSVYFKFLNQKYQSMEGVAPIEI